MCGACAKGEYSRLAHDPRSFIAIPEEKKFGVVRGEGAYSNQTMVFGSLSLRLSTRFARCCGRGGSVLHATTPFRRARPKPARGKNNRCEVFIPKKKRNPSVQSTWSTLNHAAHNEVDWILQRLERRKAHRGPSLRRESLLIRPGSTSQHRPPSTHRSK